MHIYISKLPGRYIVYKIRKTIYKRLKFNKISLQREISIIDDLPTRHSASPNPTTSASHLSTSTRHSLNNLENYYSYNNEDNLTISRYTYQSHEPTLPPNHLTKPDQQPTTPHQSGQGRSLLSTVCSNASHDSPAIPYTTQLHHGASPPGRPHTSRNSFPLRK